MKKILAAIVVSLLLLLIALYLSRERIPVMRLAVHAHAVKGSIDCGTVVNSPVRSAHEEGEIAVNCARQAYEQGQPFFVVFSGHGTDEQISHALISDGRGNAIQLIYGIGMVSTHRLMKSKCEEPLALILEPTTPYGFPRVHCAPWPPSESDLSADFILW